MSTSNQDTLQERIVAYLLERLEQDQPFVKSHQIASELNTSAKRTGQLLVHIEHTDPRVDLKRRGGNSDGTTWRVAPGKPTS